MSEQLRREKTGNTVSIFFAQGLRTELIDEREREGSCFVREKKTYFLPAVWVVRESRARLDGEVVQHEEGREVLELRRADGPPDARTGALCLLDGQEGLADSTWDARFRCHRLAVAVAGGGGKDTEVVIQSRRCLENVLLEQYYRQDSNCDGQEDRETLHEEKAGPRALFFYIKPRDYYQGRKRA